MMICVKKTKGQHMGCFCGREVCITRILLVVNAAFSGRAPLRGAIRAVLGDKHAVLACRQTRLCWCDSVVWVPDLSLFGDERGMWKGAKVWMARYESDFLWNSLSPHTCCSHSFPCAAPSSALRQWLLNLGRGFLPPKAASPSISGHFCYAVCPTLVWKQLSIH